MNRNVIAIIVIVCFFMLILSSYSLLDRINESRKIDLVELEGLNSTQIINLLASRRAERNVPMFIYIVPIAGFSGIAVGFIVYYFIQEEKKGKTNKKAVLKLLNEQERKIVEKLIKEKGKVNQSELVYLEGLTKLKVHRLLENLKKRGVIEKERVGKINIIRLNKDILKIFED